MNTMGNKRRKEGQGKPGRGQRGRNRTGITKTPQPRLLRLISRQYELKYIKNENLRGFNDAGGRTEPLALTVKVFPSSIRTLTVKPSGGLCDVLVSSIF
jgi:hypothetical protein